MKGKGYPIEVIFWSIAIPGFGQILNGKFFKGILFIFLEFLINYNSKLNLVIKYSFIGDYEKAIQVSNMEWALFYPCVYVFAIYDSYIDALKLTSQDKPKLIALPFILAAYISTLGVVYADVKPLYQIIPPVFISIFATFFGFGLGLLVRKLILRKFRLI